MLTDTHKERLIELILEEDPEIFVVDIHLKRGKKNVLSIKIDTDEGISLKTCTTVSRRINKWLEAEEPLGDNTFSLEVSSPGVGFPLKLARQYPKNVGRILRVTTNDGETHQGKLLEVNEKRIQIDTSIQTLKGRKKKNTPKKKVNKLEASPYMNLELAEIAEAKVVLD
ncbi:MAG: hypothetical protein AAF694_06210 [Bacteroidota bacterium]